MNLPNFYLDKSSNRIYSKIMKYEPALHKAVPMQARVRFPELYLGPGKRNTGTVAGIAALHVIFTYIVLLDEPIKTEYGLTSAISIGGSELESEDGLTNWRNDA